MSQFTESIKGKLFKYFEGKLNPKKSTKGWWRCNCINPGCEGIYTMAIHFSFNRVKCFKCGYNSNLIKGLMEMEEYETYSQAYEYLHIQQEYEFFETPLKAKQEFKPIELPESFRLLNMGDSLCGKSARHYMRNRGYNINSLSLKGIGYCTSGEYAGYIIFPFYHQGKLIYFQGRKYMGSGPKMHNPTTEDYGVGKSQIIFNQDALYIYNKVYVTESITNSLTMGDRGIGTLGKSISPYQLSNIIGSPCQNIIMILDPDAYKEAIDTAMQIVNFKHIKVVKLPNGPLDVNDYGKGKTLQFVKGTPYSKYMDLYKIKLNFHETRALFAPYQNGPYKGLGRGR